MATRRAAAPGIGYLRRSSGCRQRSRRRVRRCIDTKRPPVSDRRPFAPTRKVISHHGQATAACLWVFVTAVTPAFNSLDGAGADGIRRLLDTARDRAHPATGGASPFGGDRR